ncbi:Protein Jade-1, partial [Trichinella patagoniensis]
LRGPPETWPEAEREERIESLEVLEKESRATAVLVTVSPPQDAANVINPRRYSSFERLIRVTAWCRRFRHNTTLPASSRRAGTELTSDELKEAERVWIRQEQIHAFGSKESLDKAMTKMLCGLNPFLDESGVLRVGGRLGRAQLEEEIKFPALLPRKGMIVDLLIRREHNRQLHAGVAQTLAALRERFWILRGRSAVKRVLRTCGICRRVAARPFQQRMGDLPAIRVNPARPFSNVGIDFVRPLLVRSESSKSVIKKAYICLFTCMVVRAIHLELVPDQTIESFLRALRRFVARRGRPDTIQSGNFRTFNQANAFLKHLFSGRNWETVQRRLASERVEWIFITERSPWCGGYWERLVRSVKTALKATLGQCLAAPDELRTVKMETNFAMNRKRRIDSHDKENDSVILFKGLTSRMFVARTERELKHCFHVVSRWKAVYNESPVEFIPEGKQRQSIPVKRNEMFSVTPGSVRTTLRSTREDGSEFYLRCAMSISDFVFLRKMSLQFVEDEDCSSSLSCSWVIPSVRGALRTLHGRFVIVLILCWTCGHTNADANCCRNIHPSGVFPHFHPVRMHESPYKVNIQCCSVQDVHEQPEWPSASYPAACILPNYLVGSVYFVLGFVVMMIPDTEFSRNDLLLWFLQFESQSDRSPSKLEKLGTSKELNEIVVCRNCENAVHQACYGIVSLPEGDWTCNRCIYMQRTGVMPSCVLCPTETGLMKSDASGTTWLHMSCALWIPGISFGNNETMESITGVEKALKKMSSLAKKNKKQMCCSICNSSFGAFIRCQHKRCSTRFHVTCASNGNAFMRFNVNSENSDQVLFEIYCNAHAPVEQKDSTDTVDNTGKSSESFDLPSAEDSPALKNKTKAEISVIKEQFRLYWLVKRKQMNTTEPFVQVMRAAELNNSDFDRTLKLSNRKKSLTDRGKKDEAKRLLIWSDDEICDKKDEDEMVHTGMRLRSSRRSKSMGPSFYYNQLK